MGEMLVIGLVTVSMGTEMVIVRTDCTDIEMGAKEKKTSNLSRQMVTPKTAVEMLVIGMVTVSMGMEMVIVRTDCTDIEMVIVRTDRTDIDIRAKEKKTSNLRTQRMTPKKVVKKLGIEMVTVMDGMDTGMGTKGKKGTALTRN